ncbi:MAG: TonB-dependent receptor [Pseudomonadales bacterium]|mgnify:CR=1 FL=1|jgi:outer membrane receptor protein involved in Fe transport|nr:TonB-dependent receptor [Pseudomonadales bacterium]MDP6471961.1 TonB-dependent receptor [Pseudomonadales bacterium]MDP6826768.1 TonB-dependent receptor [Pseudomonadales bacterium]MDP6971002.1 TonB-dependent receptor [Pseudomonadales bacterium]
MKRQARSGITLAIAALFALSCAAAEIEEDSVLEEMVVRADSSIRDDLGTSGSVSWLSGDVIRDIHANHVHETLTRIPGVWISRGSGQEHLTAIRSAVLTGAGACGEFLYLEDGIPIRPSGFCNINNLFEVNTDRAAAIEVWRGPASAVLGGNALHGAINVVTPLPVRNSISVEAGSYGYYQVQGQYAGERLGLTLVGAGSDGYRHDTGFGQQKLSLTHGTQVGEWQIRNTLSVSNLNQETGAFVRGFEAYEDDDLRDSNPSPEAYRDAWSLRVASHWTRDETRLSPYLRRSRMQFLQHFLPGQPTETNQQTSIGVLATHDIARDRLRIRFGGQAELAWGTLEEFQDAPTQGSPFLVETRPTGLHYDYEVDSWLLAGFYDLGWDIWEATRIIHSARLEHLSYDYDNKHLLGNTRDDGTTCGFGGCLYTRPADRDDEFTDIAGRLGLERDLGELGTAYVMLGTGFRPPQMTELYRLQSGQAVADLDSERLYSLETGLRARNVSVSVFAQRTDNFILRDADGFNVSDGETKAHGVEFEARWTAGRHTLELNGTYAEHRYDFERNAARGERIEKNNMIDTAPRWLGAGRWRYQSERWHSDLEVNYLGRHYLNAANTAEYDGYVVVNWRGAWQATDRVEVFARVMNLLDEEYADRADFAFGSYRYFPAMPVQGYVGVRADL